jgi:hypothetical protein
MPKGKSLEIVLILHRILGDPFSYFMTSLNIAGNAPIPLGNDLI